MSDFLSSFQQDFIEKDRYLYLLRGLGNTLLIAVLAVQREHGTAGQPD